MNADLQTISENLNSFNKDYSDFLGDFSRKVDNLPGMNDFERGLETAKLLNKALHTRYSFKDLYMAVHTAIEKTKEEAKET